MQEYKQVGITPLRKLNILHPLPQELIFLQVYREIFFWIWIWIFFLIILRVLKIRITMYSNNLILYVLQQH